MSRILLCTAHVILATVRFTASAAGQRSVNGLELTSASAPPMRLIVQDGFSYQGRISFDLGSDFEGERYIFADSRDSVLRRLVVLQFEHVKPSSDEIYRYNVAAGQPIGSLRFLENSFAFAGTREPVASPRDEGEMTSNYLLSRGFRMPPVWLVSRFVTVATTDRKSEFILFYMEGSDLALSELYAGEEPTPLWKAMKPAVAARAREAFVIE